MIDVPPGFVPAGFSPGFLDLAGPYYLQRGAGSTIVGLRVLPAHGNYLGVAHGGVLSAMADVALSYQVHASADPPLAVATTTLTTNFLGVARIGDWLEAEARIDRLGQRLAYTSGTIRCGEALVMTMSAVFAILGR